MRIALGIALVAIFFIRPIDDLDLLYDIRVAENASWLHSSRGDCDESGLPISPSSRACETTLGGEVFAALGDFWTLKIFGAALVATAILLSLPSSPVTGGWLVGSLLVIASVGASTSVRAQVFSFVLFALCLRLLEKPPHWRGLAYLAGILVLWQNLHPSAIIMTIPCAMTAWTIFPRSPLRATILMLLPALASGATPLGLSGFELTAANTHISREVLGISEWQPPWDPSVRDAMMGFWLAVLVSMVGMLHSRAVWFSRRGLCAVAFLFASLYSSRMGVYFALAAAPLWVTLLERSQFLSHPVKGAPIWIGSGLAVLLSLALAREHAFSESARMAELLRSQTHVHRLYNYYAWAGPLAYFGNPTWELSLNGRVYLKDEAFWRRHGAEARGEVPVDESLFDAFVLGHPFQDGLAKSLEESGRWRRIFFEREGSLFVRAPITLQGEVAPMGVPAPSTKDS